MYVLHGTKEAPVLLRTPSTHEVQLRRIHLPKLFGKSGWAPKEGFRRRTKGSKQSRSVASWRRRSTVERPSAIFQTVSEGEFCERRVDGVLRSWLRGSAGGILWCCMHIHCRE